MNKLYSISSRYNKDIHLFPPSLFQESVTIINLTTETDTAQSLHADHRTGN
jgi:hypothetical protein